MPKRTALLIGAAGLTGGHCLQFLLQDKIYEKVIVFVRKKLPLIHEKLEQHVVNFDQLKATAPDFRADDVFCCLGTTIKKAGSRENFRKVDFEYPLASAQLAFEKGARQFLLVTAMGADKSSLIFYNRVKGEIENAIQKIPFSAIHLFRPSLLLGARGENRTGEKLGTVLFNLTAPLFVGPLRKYKAIEARAVAGAMVSCAKKNQTGIFVYESDEIQRLFDAS